MRFISHHKTRKNRIKTLFRALFAKARGFSSAKLFVSGHYISRQKYRIIISSSGVLFLGAVIVFAATTVPTAEPVVKSQTLNVYPGHISSETWKDIELLYSQDLSNDALYNEFDESSSATIYPTTPEAEKPADPVDGSLQGETQNEDTSSDPEEYSDEVDDSTATSSVDTPETASSTGTMPDDTTEEAERTESVTSEEEPVTESEEVVIEESETETVETEVDPEPAEETSVEEEETPEPNAVVEPEATPEESETDGGDVALGLTEGFSLSTLFLSFTNAIVDLVDPSQDEEINEAKVTEPAVTETTAAEPVVIEGIEEQTEESETENPVEEDSIQVLGTTTRQTDVTDESVVPEDSGYASNTPEEIINESPAADVNNDSDPVSADGEAEEAISTSTENSTLGDTLNLFCTNPNLENCQAHSVEFDDFGTPGAGENYLVQNAQIRFSLAARPSKDAFDILDENLQGITVSYRFDNVWHEAGNIVLTDEVSNAINGGYFLYALPRFEEIEEFENLQIRLTYYGNKDALDEIYLDALWLEVELMEDIDELPIVYERDLLLPTFNELLTGSTDFTAGEVPEFLLKYKPQKNILNRLWNSLTGEQQFYLERGEIVHERFGLVHDNLDVLYLEDGRWIIRAAETTQRLHPGKYTVRLHIREDGELFIDEFEFYWGVLAINTNKTIYAQNETVDLHMAALTDTGDTICDANLTLTIINPENVIADVPINTSGECGENNVTDVPDYLAEYQATENGTYQLRLTHHNIEGELVHSVTSSFQAQDEITIPFDIERIGPTRIYPLADYQMKIKITAREDYSGPVEERLPHGFVIESASGAPVELTHESYKTLTWYEELKAGQTKEFTYEFDAPDISPFLYLLGPATIDDFAELKKWQIASDALEGVAWLEGTQTTSGTNFNQAAAAIEWSTTTLDTSYFSTTTQVERLVVEQAGDYFVAATLPQNRSDGTNNNRSRVELAVHVNGVKQAVGVGRSSYIRENGFHNESSSHLNVLLEDLSVNDYIEIFATGVSDLTQPVATIQASAYVEYISGGETIFFATSTQSTSGTDLNTTQAELQWDEQREDTGYTHSDITNPEDITLDNAGNYLVFVNIPLDGAVARASVLGRVLLDGSEVSGGQFKQGYIRNADGDASASIHFSGVVQSTTTNQVLSISVEQEAGGGTVTVGGDVATIYVQELPSTDIYFGRGTTVTTGATNWNPTTKQAIEWTTDEIIDTAEYTHSTTLNPHQITVDTAGSYLLVYNDAVEATAARPNPIVTVEVNGTEVVGAETKSHYVRNTGGHNESSGSLTFLLEDLLANDVITVSVIEDEITATVDDSTDALLLLWKKQEASAPPAAPTLYDEPFDNKRGASTTPYFEFSATDDDGTADIRYQISWSTTPTFTSSTTRTSGTDNGFENTASSTDTDPFTEGDRIRFTVQPADELVDETTYWWRVRAQDVGGSGNYGDWTIAQSFTVDESVDPPDWHQTQAEQFETNTLTKTAATSSGVQIDDNVSVSILDAWTTGNSKTISAGEDRLLVVSVFSEDSGTDVDVDEVTYGGVTMTQIEEQQAGTGFSNGIWLGYINEEEIQNAVGTTITPTWVVGSPDNGIGFASIVLENVDQADPIRNSSSNFDTTGSTIQVPDVLDVEAGDITLYTTLLGQQGASHTEDTGYTEGTEEDFGGNSMTTASAYKLATTTGTEQPTATWSASFRMGMAAAVFKPGYATGTVQSGEIDVDWVPNQGAWGEVRWNVAESAGSTTTVQVYYTNTLSCDTLIPNGDLPGNDSGFLTSQSPLDISGLSTTTYSQICLQANLDKGSTSTSPILNEWTVSWVRNPVLTQNYYRWYNNADTQTPTDTWPPGSTESELGENEAIPSADPVADGDVIRLRMSINATSTAASSGSLAFTLQYAEGDTCSADLAWQDVGDIGSTTALWRGYDNASVLEESTLSSTTLSVSDTFATYEEENNSALLPNAISIGDDAEWDWVLEQNDASPDTSYCFRMIRSDDGLLDNYTRYPQLRTNAAPTVTLSRLFDNEKTASTSPEFEFIGIDSEGEDVHYQIQVDDDIAFGSTVIDTNTEVNLTDFENLNTPSDKAPYNHNESIRYTSAATLTNGTTYWWRVRAKDPDGSNQYGDWSTLRSFTVDTSVTVSTWFQTTNEQFETDTLEGVEATGGSASLITSSTTGTTTSSAIDFDDATTGNAWGEFSFNDTENSGDILHFIEYYTGSAWTLIPDGALSGNSAGFDTSPVSLIDLDSATYNQIRIRSNYTDGAGDQSIDDWTVSWGQRVSVPTHLSLFDNEKAGTTTPTFTFLTTDPEGDDLEYEFSWSTDNTFATGSTTRNSGLDTGFSNITNGVDTTPFNSGDTIQFTIQPADALTSSSTYWWRVRARDPGGSNSYSFWSDPWSLTVDESITVATWFQTTKEQFETDVLSEIIASTSNSAIIPDSVSVGILDGFTTGSTKTVSAGSNRLLVVSIFSEDSGTSVDVNSARYGNQLLTEIAGQEQGTGYSNGVWSGYLRDADIENAEDTNITVTWLGGTPDNNILYSSVVLENVDQGDPLREWSGNAGTSASIQPTTTIAVQEGDMAIYATVDGQTAPTHTPATDYTEGTEETAADIVADAFSGATAYRSITADGTEQPTAVWSAANRSAIVAFSIRKAAAVTSGTLTSTAIDFDDGSGPAWEQVYWTDSEPGTSALTYQIEYFTSTSSWALVPDSEIPGNSSGTTTFPINIKFLDTETYNQLRLVANFQCDGSLNCPSLEDWTLEWTEGIDISGTIQEYDQSTNVNSGTVAVAVNGVLQVGKIGTVSGGSWQIDNVTMFPGDVITVFVSGAADADEAVAITKYDGIPEMSGIELYERHLSVGSDDLATTSNADIGQYDFSDDEDLFFDVDAFNDLDICATTGCSDAELIILSGNNYTPEGDITVHDIEINGEFLPETNTIRVGGSWDNNGQFDAGGSTIIFTATSTTESVSSTGAATSTFNNVTFGETSGTATWQLQSAFDVDGDVTIDHGTLDQNGANTISYAGNLLINANGLYSKGTATTTFEKAGLQTWTDNSSPKQDLGIVAIDGATTTVQLGSDVALTDLVIGTNDVFTLTGSNYNVTVYGNWTNNNTFTAQQGEVIFAATGPTVINDGGSIFYDLTFNGVGGSWSFTNSVLTVDGDLTIATGTATLPTGTTTIDGSFVNLGGSFAHNNGTLYFTSNNTETITANGGIFTNTFYDLIFDGSGTWTITDTNATSSNDVIIQSGTLVFPGGIISVGGTLTNNGGTINGNNGTLQLTSAAAEILTIGGSSLSSLLTTGSGSWSFADSNVTVTDDVIVSDGILTLPSDTLAIGGSYNNAATVTNNNGTVLFDSTDTGETITSGSSDLYNVTFDSTTGGWTITDGTTVSNNFELTNASDFVLSPGQTLIISGLLTNSIGGASTTWTGTILTLNSGTSYAVNTKSDDGDVYGILDIDPNTDVSMWNSSALAYVVDPSGSVYSQDHANVDGDLYIWGEYNRTSGTEHWSYATDFDSTDLTGGSERQVNVRLAANANATIADSTLSIVGTSTATTTIQSQSGTYSMVIDGSTTTAQHYAFTDFDGSGLVFTGSTTVTAFDDGSFIPTVNTGTTITISSTTIDTNPEFQIFRVRFATTTAITATNVTQNDGTPSSYWWFRESTGNIDGEAYDNDTGDPGSIRWDDSSYSITVSGTVYSDEGSTAMGAPTCDGATNNVRIVVDGGAAFDGPCSAADGSYSIAGVTYNGDPVLTVFLNTGGGQQAVTVTQTPTTDITGLDLYANRVITRHEDIAALTIADMAVYDNTDDSDIRFTAATGSPDVLTVFPDNELHVWATTTFTPAGTVTLESGGSGNSYDGTLHISNGATFTGVGTTTYSIGGSFLLDSNATFISASSTIEMTATTSGKTINTEGGATLFLSGLRFTGVGGGWNINDNISAADDIEVATGTVTGTGDITLINGSLFGNGLLSLGGGTSTIERSNTLGGTQAWTFNNLTLGNGSVVGTTSPAAVATTTILGTLTINTAHFLDAGSSSWDLRGNGTVFVEDGTFLEDTSKVRYGGNGAMNILSTNYHDLDLNANAASPTYTATGLGIIVRNDLTVGGESTTTATFATNDPALQVDGDVFIGSNGTFIASDSASFTVAGSWDNDGGFTGSNGAVVFTSADAFSIEAGNAAFSNVNVTGAGALTVTEHATATNAWTLASTSNFTLNSGNTLAVGGTFTNGAGGAGTTWIGSTLYLYGGNNYEINTKTTEDAYATLLIGNDTDIRMWNSGATTITVGSSGSLYSMDHNDVAGDLYIYGNYPGDGGIDYWSYATDFDGTDLTGGSERQTDVYFASGSSATYTNGGLQVLGVSSASTTLQNQGVGTYGFRIGGSASTTWTYYTVRDTDNNGLVFSGTPNVTTLSRGDIEVSQAGGSGMTVGGTAIDANPARNFTNNRFATTTAINAFNVTATGTSVSSWRFTNHIGNISGETFDVDPDGDPGYVVWDDSAALITVSGTVYSDEGSTPSGIGVCDGVAQNVHLVVAGLTSYTTSCANGTGVFNVPNVAFSANDTLTLYIDNGVASGATVSIDPISSINNMDLYENRVIVRHEGSDPIMIADMAVWDSSDDADIPFTAVDGSTDTLTLPSDTKLIIWSSKEFEPNGNVTLSGGGAGASYDGTLELYANAAFDATGSESHAIGGSFISGSGASFDDETSTVTFTTSGSARTIDTNEDAFYNLVFNGTGSWTVTNTNLSVDNDLTITNGTITWPGATTTIGGSLLNTGGTFNASNGTTTFTGAGSETVQVGSSDLAAVIFDGTGSFTFVGSNATATGDFIINDGTVTGATGILAIGGDFINNDTYAHGGGVIRMYSGSTGTLLTAGGSDLYAATFDGAGDFTFTDNSLALLDTLTIDQGSVTFATNTMSIGGSFINNGGSFDNASGTILFNSSDTGEIIDPGGSPFYAISLSNVAGGWTIVADATTTQNFSLTSANDFTQQSGTTLRVEGVFTNTVGGSATTWTASTLDIQSGTGYTINTKAAGGDQYDTLIIGSNTDLRAWNSAATAITIDSASSFYSQDHGGIDGELYIYGDYIRTAGTDYWNYATDFDGAALGGSSRTVTVSHATSATTTINGGTLEMLGDSSGTTTITNQGSGNYALRVLGGTLNALNYAVRNIDANGLVLSGTSTIASLSSGDYELAVNAGSLITLSSTTLNANASKVITNVRFATTSPISGNNVELIGTTASAWTFNSHQGNLDGETYDVDGGTDCGSIRWDDSSCQLTEQTNYRWRNDDGGEGVPDSEWYNASWDKRKRVSLTNTDSTAYATATIRLDVIYDSDMQSDFDDLRFTEDDGTTLLSHWIETVNASADAVVWIEVFDLSLLDTTNVYMYYGNATATDASATTTFLYLDDFEDNNITEYSGDTTLFAANTTFNYEGVYGLDATNNSGKTTDGIYNTNVSVTQGETIRYLQYVDTGAGSGDEPCTLFGVQSPGSNNNNYAVCLEQFGTDRVSLSKDVSSNDSDGPATVLASSTATYVTGWHEVEIGWQTDNTIDVTVSRSGSIVATTSINDASYTSGGVGFSYWFQNGGWDIYSSRPYLENEPSVAFGAEQVPGGATWAAALNTAYTGAILDETARIRFVFENSGLPVTNQEFLLEYAAKGASPSCEAVSVASYASVPAQASCSGSPICTQASANFANNDATTDLLGTDEKVFVTGEIIESPSNKTSAIDVSTDEYTELEYAIVPTSDVTDQNYCLRITNDSTDFDSYTRVAELQLRFDPTITALSLNGGNDISLTPGATTTVYATGTVTDLNGYTDIDTSTSTIFRSGVGIGCSEDDNNCYISAAPLCSFNSCSGNSCDVSCSAEIYYFAEPTDTGTYAGETWRAYLEVSDQSGAIATATAPSIDLLTLRAIDVDDAIDYGTLAVSSDTGAFNASTTVENIGNDNLDISISGSDLTDGGSSLIDVSQQLFATSTFTYSACVFCSTLATTTTNIEVDLSKPTTTSSVTDEVYWGINVPFGVAGTVHQGTNIFYAIGD